MIRDDQIAAALGMVALALVLGALGFQILGHLAPCEMCHWQRWAHICAAIVGLIGTRLAGSRLWKRHVHLWVIAVLVVVGICGIAVTGQWFNAPYLAAAVILLAAVFALAPDRRAAAVAAVALVAVSGLIGAYQSGMQIGVLPGPSACTVAHAYVLGSGAPPPQVSCTAVTWSLFGLSLAAYNGLISLGAAALGTILLMKKS
jgi:disulfide bond formation protein DsbB